MTGLSEHAAEAAGSAAWLVRETGAAGIDVDWEYPGQGAASTTALSTFISTYRLQAPGDALLTAAVSVDPTNFPSAASAAGTGKWDELHVMTYDWAGSWVSTFQHNTSLKQAKQAIQNWISAGYEPRELSVGVPFYGKTVQVASPGQQSGLNQPTSNASWWQTLTYAQVAALDRTQYAQEWDTEACAPWLWDKVGLNAVTYCDTHEIQYTKEYACLRGLCGIFAWCASQDDQPNTLTQALLKDSLP
jgi:chitinase